MADEATAGDARKLYVVRLELETLVLAASGDSARTAMRGRWGDELYGAEGGEDVERATHLPGGYDDLDNESVQTDRRGEIVTVSEAMKIDGGPLWRAETVVR